MPQKITAIAPLGIRRRWPSFLTPLAILLVGSLLITGCGLGLRRFGTGTGSGLPIDTQPPPTASSTSLPTGTPVPTATMTLIPTPDPGAVGLPSESTGTSALDFVATMCKASWFTESGALPCPGDQNNSNAGFVISLPGDVQGLSSGFPVLLTYPPQDNSETIFSRYPAFTVQKGDRFRTVLECRSHSFCDVEFALEYYNANGNKNGIAHWAYRFTDAPIVVDYSLDGVAGLPVQFGLSLRGVGNRIDAYGVWMLPHIYRPGS